jgi:hypothetical protein
MVVAGAGLGAYVWAAWPEAETRIVRLPYGEALPKVPRAPAVERPAPKPVPSVDQPAGTVAAEPAEPEPVRVVAVAEPVVAPAPPPTRAPVYLAPRPVASAEEGDGYVETAEELGAEWLPGHGVTPAPPAAG